MKFYHPSSLYLISLSHGAPCTVRRFALKNAFTNFFTANERHFICGEIAAEYRQNEKCAKPFGKNQTMPSWQEPVLHKSLGKGSSVICRILYNQGEKSSPNWPHGGSKNIILCFFANMRYIRDGICTGCIRRWIYYLYISVP